MVELSTQKQLALLFPHSNKALLQSLQQATPEQLATLSEAKDLSSLLKGLITDTLDVKKSNTIILEILKNSEFFKEMGTFSKELKSLSQYLQANEKTLAKTTPPATPAKASLNAPQNMPLNDLVQALEQSLEKLGEKPQHDIKSLIKNSGLFWESKISQTLQPHQTLANALENIQTQLSDSKLPQAKNLLEQLKPLLEHINPPAQETPELHSPSIQTSALKQPLQSLIEQFVHIGKQRDALFSKPVENLLQQLKTELAQPQSRPEHMRQIIDDIRGELRISKAPAGAELLKTATALVDQLQNFQGSDKTAQLLNTLSEKLQTLSSTIPLNDVPELPESISKLQQISRLPLLEKERMIPEIIQFVQQLPQKLPIISQTDGIMDMIHKILDALKPPTEGSFAQSLQQDAQAWVKQFEQVLSKADPLFSASLHKQVQALEQLLNSPSLSGTTLLQEELHQDLKALLLQLDQDLPKATTPNDVLKSVDKLLLQVEYFQLLSHLSHEAFVYIPYHWDMLENGHLAIKKAKDNSTYCEIDLELCEYGKLNIMLQLYDDNQLNISIHTEQAELSKLFLDNKEQLLSALRSVNIMPRTIKIRQQEPQTAAHPYAHAEQLNALGFEAKG